MSSITEKRWAKKRKRSEIARQNSMKRFEKKRKEMEQINQADNNAEIEQPSQIEEVRNIPQIQANQAVDQYIQVEDSIIVHPDCSYDQVVQAEDPVIVHQRVLVNKKRCVSRLLNKDRSIQTPNSRMIDKCTQTDPDKDALQQKKNYQEATDKIAVLETRIKYVKIKFKEYQKENNALKKKVERAKNQLEKKKKLVADLREAIKIRSKRKLPEAVADSLIDEILTKAVEKSFDEEDEEIDGGVDIDMDDVEFF